MPNFVGFNGDMLTRVQTVHQTAKNLIDEALLSAWNDNDRFMLRIQKYFSAGGGKNWGDVSSAVMKTLNSMKLAADTNTYVVHLEAQKPGSNAECASWQQTSSKKTKFLGTMFYNNKLMNVLEAQFAFSLTNGPSKMSLYPSAFANPFWVADGQCQVETYLHELSHVAAGTVDVSDGGLNPYGLAGVKGCRLLGLRSAQNAENIGFFISSFF